MSLVTRCPACSTMFKVVPDQIRIAAGWVRCGHCGEVFDASAHMLPYERTARPAKAPPPAPAADAPADAVSTAHLLVHRSASSPEPETDDTVWEPPADFAPTEVDAAIGPDGWPQLEPPPAAKPPTIEMPPDLPDASAGAPDAGAPPAQEALPEPADAAAEPEVPAEPAPATEAESAPAIPAEPADPRGAPSFVTEARRRAAWSSRPVRAMLWLALALLALGLALQVVLSQRDWLAARQPQLTPVLQALCAPLGCRVSPYRQLDAIVIDSSAFNRVGPGSFRFSVTLHNASDLPVASPALELTLTDAQDQPLVRRVVSAAELGAPPALAARGEFSGTSVLAVGDAANPSAIVGYRLTAFYP
ncbi:DUF3426 domain-containing protein [Ottowia sp.]|uniref:DUF3426 domain-containing protein n=1 Tax=Ottowia sp. TaxID=1898956 RepID=UPI0039E60572